MPQFVSGGEASTPSVYAVTGQTHAAKHMPFNPPRGYDPNADRAPDYWIYIYTVAKKRHSKDAHFPIRKPPLYPCLIFHKCDAGEPFKMVAKIPSVVNHRWTDDQGEVRNTAFQGERVATDICNPLNLTNDIWQEVAAENSFFDAGGTDDLTRRGVFWSLHNPPNQEEIQKARDRMERHFESMITLAEEMHAKNEDRFIPPECHEAAEFFSLDAPWHRRARATVTCGNCGGPIREGVAYHQGPYGICVIDHDRTVAAIGEQALAHLPNPHKAKAKPAEK